MNERFWLRAFNSFFDNLNSTITNLKWVGIISIIFTFALCGAVAEAQQVGKVTG